MGTRSSSIFSATPEDWGLGGRHWGAIEGIQASEDDGATQFRLTVLRLTKGGRKFIKPGEGW